MPASFVGAGNLGSTMVKVCVHENMYTLRASCDEDKKGSVSLIQVLVYTTLVIVLNMEAESRSPNETNRNLKARSEAVILIRAKVICYHIRGVSDV